MQIYWVIDTFVMLYFYSHFDQTKLLQTTSYTKCYLSFLSFIILYASTVFLIPIQMFSTNGDLRIKVKSLDQGLRGRWGEGGERFHINTFLYLYYNYYYLYGRPRHHKNIKPSNTKLWCQEGSNGKLVESESYIWVYLKQSNLS